MNLLQKAVFAINKTVNGQRIPLTTQNRNMLWQLMGGFIPLNWNNSGNVQVNEGYIRNVDVYSIVKKIVDVSKSIPWVVEKQQSSGNWKVIENTTIHELMNQPNMSKGYTWNDIEEQVLLYLLITGNSYLVGNTQVNSTLIEELDILPSQAINILNRNSNFFIPDLEFQFSFGSTSRIYKKSEIEHIKFFNPNLQRYDYGLSPIEVASRVVEVGNQRWIADASILGNKGISGLVSDKSNNAMTPDEADIVNDEMRNRMGGADKFGQVLVTNKDLTYIPIGLSPADMQLLEKGVVTTRTLCNVLGLDSSLFNDPENKTYNNRLEAEKAMYTNCIIPLSDKVSEAYTHFICKNHFPLQNVRMRQDFSKVECLQENLKEKADILASFKDKGIYTANEVREKMGEPKSTDPNADLLIINTTPINNIQNPQQQQPN